jgi:hypothetical protein
MIQLIITTLISNNNGIKFINNKYLFFGINDVILLPDYNYLWFYLLSKKQYIGIIGHTNGIIKINQDTNNKLIAYEYKLDLKNYELELPYEINKKYVVSHTNDDNISCIINL